MKFKNIERKKMCLIWAANIFAALWNTNQAIGQPSTRFTDQQTNNK